MAAIKLSDELSDVLSAQFSACADAEAIKRYLAHEEPSLMQHIKELVARYKFVHVSNVHFPPERKTLEALISFMGDFIYPVENTRINVDCSHDGCTLGYLEMHTDDANLIERQPRYAVLQVAKEDPLKLTHNGVVLVDDIVNYLSLYDSELLERLTTHALPMLAAKFTRSIVNEQIVFNIEGELETNSPILVKKDDYYICRLDLGRVNYYYYKRGKVQSLEEKRLISDFLILTKKFRQEMYLSRNDLLFYDNQRILHDRTPSCVELGLKGEFNSRAFYIAFAHEYAK